MSGIMFNEDSTHFAYSRFKAGRRVTLDVLNEFIDQYAGTQIKEFVLNVNAMTAWFPSVTRENAVNKYASRLADGTPLGDVGEIVKVLYDVYIEQGIDAYKIWIDRLRNNGISPWISIRMNDIHNASEPDHFLVTKFYNENPQAHRYAHRTRSSYYDSALDYTKPEVREHYLEFIREVTERYDFDGLELDWMREPFTLGIGKELEGAKIITAFMLEIREILDGAEATRGHRIKMSARVPFSPEVSLRFGLDAIGWARTGLVDALIVSPRWQTTDNDMPIDLWKQLLEGTGVMLCACLEILISPVRSWPAGPMNSVETARGSAVAYLGMGADRVYLFNYFDDDFSGDKSSIPSGHYAHPDNYRELLTTVGDLTTATPLPRRHIVTFHDITAPGMRLADTLPFKCGPRRFPEARIPTGPIAEDAKVSIIVGVDTEDPLDASDFHIYINSVKCTYTGPYEAAEPKPAAGRLYAFAVPHGPDFPQASIVEIGAPKNTFMVHWLEIRVS